MNPEILETISLFSNTFNRNGYDVIITPNRENTARYRGTLERSWFRQDPSLLRTLYNGKSMAAWTMVGTVTYVSQNGSGTKEQTKALGGLITEKSVRDTFQEMFDAGRVVETMFLESNAFLEIIVSPVAIYREVLLSDDTQES